MDIISMLTWIVIVTAIVLLFLSFHYKDKPIFKFQRRYSGIISLVIGVLGLVYTLIFVKNSILLYLFFVFIAAVGLIQLVKNNK